MTKKDTPKHVYRKGRRGYLYFIKPGICVRIHSEIGTADFAAEYARLMRGNVAAPVKTIAKLIDAYRRSPKWAKLAFNTRKSYGRSLDYFFEVAGKVDPDKLTRVHVNQMRDALADKPTDANRKIDALNALMKWGTDNGWCSQNPAARIERLETIGRVRTPWPQTFIDAFRATATGRTLLLFEMLIGTGQRISDVLQLRWSDLDADGFTLTQGKTKTKLFVPLTDRLRAALATAPRKGLFIIAQDNGMKVSYNLAWKDFMTIRQKIGAEAYDIHALRYAAASEIAAIPGMTSEHVQAITGHTSAAMARLYAGPAMQRARATEAQGKRK